MRPPARHVLYRTASFAIERLKGWSTWLTGVVVGAIAAMGLLAKGRMLRRRQQLSGFYALRFFGASLLFSVWLVATLPGVLLQLFQLSSDPSKSNDVYRNRYGTLTGVQITGLLALQHIYSVIDVGCFAVLIYLMFSDSAGESSARGPLIRGVMRFA